MVVQIRGQNIPYNLLFVFILLTLGIGLAGYFYHENLTRELTEEERNGILAIAELKVNEISRWRKERMADALAILENPFISHEIQNWLSNPSEPSLARNVLAWMTSLHAHYDYARVMLVGVNGVTLLSLPDDKQQPNFQLLTRLPDINHSKKPFFSDLYRGDSDEKIAVCVIIPILNRVENYLHPIAYLFLVIDPYRFLFPLVQSWPTPSLTSETLLVRREGNDVLFLNELRHRKETALTLRLPGNTPGALEAMALHGGEGIINGLDYRGKAVHAAVRAIPESPWFLIAKMDAEETDALIHKHASLVALLVGVMIGAAGISVGFIWSQQNAHFFRKQFESEMKKLELTQRYVFLTKHANDIILIFDQDGNITEANERGVASYGYTPDEFARLNIGDLRAPEAPSLLEEHLLKETDGKGMVFETVHRRKDGTTFPVEISSRILKLGNTCFLQNIIRDITERKQAEQALREAHEQLEMRVRERTTELLNANQELTIEISGRRRVEEALRKSQRELRSRSSQLLTAQENERKRIACELHDSIGQTLTAVKLAIENANRLAAKGHVASKTFPTLIEMVQHSIEEARRIYMNLRPSLLDDLGILETIDWFCQEMSKIHTKFRTERQMTLEESDIPEALKIVIFRIVQEGINNIANHSKADLARISLIRSDGRVHLSIADNGQGFDVDEALSRATARGSLGLTSMRERTELSGGTFAIRSIVGAGTTIDASWPSA